MDRWIAALLAGLVGGVGGTLAVRELFPPPAASELGSQGTGGVDARLERIEASLAALAARGPMLEGSAGPAGGRSDVGGPGGMGAVALTGPAGEAFKKALREELGAALDQRLEKLGKASDELEQLARVKPPEKKRVNLADAARDLELTAQQEDELRRVYTTSQDKMLRLAAGEGGDIEAVRREVEEASRDPKKRPLIMAKYMPRMLPKLGELITIQMEQQTAVEAVVGPDKAARIDNEFDLIEANPLGAGGSMQVGASVRSR